MAVEAIDWKTGEMIRATEYLSRILGGDIEVDEVSADEFARAVTEIGERLSQNSRAPRVHVGEARSTNGLVGRSAVA